MRWMEAIQEETREEDESYTKTEYSCMKYQYFKIHAQAFYKSRTES